MFAPSVQKEVHYVREVLEGAFAPHIASQLMFDVLADSGTMPSTPREVLAFCRGPLADKVEDVAGIAVRDAILDRLEQVLVQRDWSGTDIPIDIELEGDRKDETLIMPTVWREPVSVLIVASTASFGELLLASIGQGRVAPNTVAGGEAAIRKAVFSSSPLIVIVDATSAPALERGEIATLLRTLPDGILSVVWGVETEYGEGLCAALKAAQIDANGLRYAGGLAPLLDLVLSRYQS